ncbi:hypothetical protein L1987_03327 [Smallanthus sonchifolius]|uniref:Uncharacterized protein n=1 Tax=Smallanthus sonchifolius TaxID=185202 RepID=A0ACB9KAG8_9ASTR|nr:hypothetical protein L1987_03327 [Smallanthus sonchifolius]
MEDEQANQENDQSVRHDTNSHGVLDTGIGQNGIYGSSSQNNNIEDTTLRKRIKRKSNVSSDDCNQDQAVCNQDELSKVAKDMDPLGEDEYQFDSQRGGAEEEALGANAGKGNPVSDSISVDLNRSPSRSMI